MISVIIPTHKRADLLFYELEQIYKQKDVKIEVVVVNDIEDHDETDRIIELFPDVVYIKSKEIQGPSEKHKKGFSITRGEYVYMPDDDDYLIDDHFFVKAEQILNSNNSVSFVSGNVNIRYEDDKHSEIRTTQRILNNSGEIDGLEYLQEFQHKYMKPASTVSTIFRRSALDVNMIEMSDSSIYMQALLNGNAFIMNDIVAVYRVQKRKGNSLTSSASLPFIKKVLRQKEQFYISAKETLPRPKDFWSYHFAMTYYLLSQKPDSKKERTVILKWGISHSHGSIRILAFIIKEFIRLKWR